MDAITEFPLGAPAWPDFGLRREALADEMRRMPKPDAAEAVRCFYRLYSATFGKARWGDKTPGYCRSLPVLATMFPEGRFVHIIRDGRDVAVSLREMWFAPGRDIASLAAKWRDDIEIARAAGLGDDRYLELRYEALVDDPGAELTRVCEFLSLAYEPAMLGFHERAADRLREHRERLSTEGDLVVSRERRLQQQQSTLEPVHGRFVGKWRSVLNGDELAEFEAVAGELLARLGY